MPKLIVDQPIVEESIVKFELFLKNSLPFDTEAFEYSRPLMKLLQYSKGELFVEEGKVCRNFGFVVSGFVAGFLPADGQIITSCLCSENHFATVTSSFLMQRPSEKSIMAMKDSLIIIISSEDFRRLCQSFGFWKDFWRITIENEYLEADSRLRTNVTLTPDMKYLSLLRDHPHIFNQVPLHIIASYIGIRPETLSRIRKRTSRIIS